MMLVGMYPTEWDLPKQDKEGTHAAAWGGHNGPGDVVFARSGSGWPKLNRLGRAARLVSGESGQARPKGVVLRKAGGCSEIGGVQGPR